MALIITRNDSREKEPHCQYCQANSAYGAFGAPIQSLPTRPDFLNMEEGRKLSKRMGIFEFKQMGFM